MDYFKNFDNRLIQKNKKILFFCYNLFYQLG
jgi:hypothetical protein